VTATNCCLKAPTHTPETSSRNGHHKLNAGFWRQFFVPIVLHKKLALIYVSKLIMAGDQDTALSSDCDIDQFNTEQKSIFATRSSSVIHFFHRTHHCYVVSVSDGYKLLELVETGQTENVIRLLVTWLQHCKVYLSDSQPVLGNVDIVTRLIDEHQVIVSLYQ